mmetsp:Transcript_153911/g.286849  ORF Transcript_153911/g.286849 Transcript_153911/m.286849 type:complete len:264 (-) Transcript_153911:1501-2292(-)
MLDSSSSYLAKHWDMYATSGWPHCTGIPASFFDCSVSCNIVAIFKRICFSASVVQNESTMCCCMWIFLTPSAMACPAAASLATAVISSIFSICSNLALAVEKSCRRCKKLRNLSVCPSVLTEVAEESSRVPSAYDVVTNFSFFSVVVDAPAEIRRCMPPSPIELRLVGEVGEAGFVSSDLRLTIREAPGTFSASILSCFFAFGSSALLLSFLKSLETAVILATAVFSLFPPTFVCFLASTLADTGLDGSELSVSEACAAKAGP